MTDNVGHDSGSDGQTSDDCRTQVQRLAAYAHRAQFGDLSPISIRQLPVHVLDCLACCLAAPGAPPVDACRAQVHSSLIPGDLPPVTCGPGQWPMRHCDCLRQRAADLRPRCLWPAAVRTPAALPSSLPRLRSRLA